MDIREHVSNFTKYLDEDDLRDLIVIFQVSVCVNFSMLVT